MMIDVWLACGLQTVLVLIVMTGIKKWWKWAYARQVEYKSICLKSCCNDAENNNHLASPPHRSNSIKKEQLAAVLVEELAGG